MPLLQLHKMGSEPIYLRHCCCSCSSVNTHIESNTTHLLRQKNRSHSRTVWTDLEDEHFSLMLEWFSLIFFAFAFAPCEQSLSSSPPKFRLCLEFQVESVYPARQVAVQLVKVQSRPIVKRTIFKLNNSQFKGGSKIIPGGGRWQTKWGNDNIFYSIQGRIQDSS